MPIVIAGGPMAKNDREIIEMCAGAMEAGAQGITFGRNIFQHRSPPAIVRALSMVILEGKSSREAISYLDRKEKVNN